MVVKKRPKPNDKNVVASANMPLISSEDTLTIWPCKLRSALETTFASTSRLCSAHIVSDFGSSRGRSASSLNASVRSTLDGGRGCGAAVFGRCTARCKEKSRVIAPWPGAGKSSNKDGKRSNGSGHIWLSGRSSICFGLSGSSESTPDGQNCDTKSSTNGLTKKDSASPSSSMYRSWRAPSISAPVMSSLSMPTLTSFNFCTQAVRLDSNTRVLVAM
mmetsp:Transcript_50000/g.152132  ORF Transcript_50000/g.152132 Transcript_50000/m.152132 type:complete len:217 (+) Transcript_50000:595-1245(+)